MSPRAPATNVSQGGMALFLVLARQRAITAVETPIIPSELCLQLLDRREAAYSEVVEHTFAIPELLEHILLYLDTRDLLGVLAVSKGFFDVMRHSVKIQQALMRAPARHFRLFDEGSELPGFLPGLFAGWDDCLEVFERAETRTGVDQGRATISKLFIIRQPWEDRDPKVSEHCKRMLVSHPPVTELDVYATCCFEGETRLNIIEPTWSTYQAYIFGAAVPAAFAPGAGLPILPPPPDFIGLSLPPGVSGIPCSGDPNESSDGHIPKVLLGGGGFLLPGPDLMGVILRNGFGIRVGDLMAAAELVRKSHKYCPYAKQELHCADSTVQVSVAVLGKVSLAEDDPIMENRRNAVRESQSSYPEESSPQTRRMRCYIKGQQYGG